MSLEPGRRLGAYEILGPLGAGGMGEVYRARDAKLDREVAVKVLPEHVSGDASGLARFEREAKAVAALSHPNILAIHDFGSADGRAYAVTELLEGETLRERLEDGPLGLHKAAELGRQIARGLGAAHEKGIVHRDLKPENVFVTRDGRTKILDFGLAARTEERSGGDEDTPTRTSLTEPGAVMGTAGYMSPEQVRGQATDARSDIFSFGAVLFEMVTGHRAFQRETGAETMTAILREEPPDAQATGAQVPPALASVIRRCLEKRPDERFHSAHDLAFALEAMGTTTSAQSIVTGPAAEGEPAPSRSRAGFLVAVALVMAAAGFAAGRWLAPATPAGQGSGAAGGALSQLTFGAGQEFMPVIAPDGGSVVYVVPVDQGTDLMLQRVGGETAINLTASRAGFVAFPAFSPDGTRIAFAGLEGLFVMGATGESPRRLTDSGFNPAWSPDGTRLVVGTEAVFNPFGRSTRSSLHVIDVGTGDSEPLDLGGADAVQPSWSPGGHRIAFWGLPPGTGKRTLYTAPAEGGEPVPLTDDTHFNWNPVWSADGRWLYFASDRGGVMNVWRLPIDERTGEKRGPAEPVTLSTQDVGLFDVARDGSLVFAASSTKTTVTRQALDVATATLGGEAEELIGGSRQITSFAPSPDGRWLAFYSGDPQEDLFVIDTESGALSRLTNDPAKDRWPRWDSESRSMVFFSDRDGHYETWTVRPDGSGLRQLSDTNLEMHYNPIVSPDGRRIVAHVEAGAMMMDYPEGDGMVTTFEALPVPEGGQPFFATAWSPDGTRLVGTTGVQQNAAGVWVYDVETQVYTQLDEDAGSHTGWCDDSWILAREGRSSFVVDPSTGEKRRITGIDLGDGLPFGGVECDEIGNVYFLERVTEGDVWLLRP